MYGFDECLINTNTNIYTVATVDATLWFVTLHTISKEQIMHAEWWIFHGKVRVACKVPLVCKMYIHIHL